MKSYSLAEKIGEPGVIPGIVGGIVSGGGIAAAFISEGAPIYIAATMGVLGFIAGGVICSLPDGTF